MAIDSYIKIGSLKGESVVKGFEDQIQVLSWSWGMAQTGASAVGSGGGAGKVNVQDLSFTHYVDAASPNLMIGCCTGEHYDKATLTMRKAGGSALDYVVVELTDVLITNVATGGSVSDDMLTENVSLNFGAFKFTYQPQDNKGAKKGGAIVGAFNVATNVKA